MWESKISRNPSYDNKKKIFHSIVVEYTQLLDKIQLLRNRWFDYNLKIQLGEIWGLLLYFYKQKIELLFCFYYIATNKQLTKCRQKQKPSHLCSRLTPK
jgi:hypothetical protein